LRLDKGESNLLFSAGRGFLTETINTLQLPKGVGLAWQAVNTRQPVFYPRGSETDTIAFTPFLQHEKFVSYWAFPLIVKDTIKGVMEAFQRSVFHPNEDWLSYLEALAGQAAIALDNAELLDNLKKANEELLESYNATIVGWSLALEFKDKETRGHAERVTHLAMRMAQEVGLPEEEMVHFRRGVLLHDIGKMGIPDSILLKPGPLTQDEWEVMHQHPTLAWKLLKDIPFLKPALDIPYCHHERWDGNGYPRGLKGEEIPLGARIFAIVDVWDALTSDRPYRSAWIKDRTLQYMQKQSGKHFDPALIEKVLPILEEKI
jgi:HD-GYP domain-containing protein (c-di-GMP phosphodiesterase class II)